MATDDLDRIRTRPLERGVDATQLLFVAGRVQINQSGFGPNTLETMPLKINALKRHRLAAARPNMRPSEREALKKDIVRRGVAEKIILYEEDVLDGWERLCVLKEAGLEIDDDLVETFEGSHSQAIALLLDHGVWRHLSCSQKALYAGRLRCFGGSAGAAPTQKELAETFAISVRQIRDAEDIERSNPQLAELVADKQLSIAYGRCLLKGPMETLQAFLETDAKGRKAIIKAARAGKTRAEPAAAPMPADLTCPLDFLQAFTWLACCDDSRKAIIDQLDEEARSWVFSQSSKLRSWANTINNMARAAKPTSAVSLEKAARRHSSSVEVQHNGVST